ncbi:MAG: hypothetical protein E4H20_07750 [Spirochaetales bacterium]|nr:MAG: hypothetical protein E4H20_07750 [Spirochaetales bacterium]
MMDVRKVKEAQLAELKAALVTVEGTPTEVYSRIVGYYRAVRNWNAGKREEFSSRKEYDIASPTAWPASLDGAMARRSGVDGIATAATGARPVSYLLFTRRSCPNCPPLREFMSSCALSGQLVDVDADEGPDLAAAYEVLATPTVILLGSDGEELARGYTKAQLLALLTPVKTGSGSLVFQPGMHETARA